MTQASQTRFISLAQWCALAQEGLAPPVTICLEGDSMRPRIRRGLDPVTIVPLSKPLQRGDVVLFRLGEKHIVHRVWKLRPGMVQTFGDNCWNPEPWFPENQVLGQVVTYSRNGKTHRLDTPAARAWGRLWLTIHPARRVCLRLKNLAAKVVRRLRKEVRKYE